MSGPLTYRAKVLGAFFLVSGLACRSELRLDAWHGEYLLYESEADLQVCQGTYAWLDRFVPFLAGELGIDAGGVQSYRWVQESNLDCTEETALGCSTGVHAFSKSPVLPHELVHTTMSSLGYPYQPFFGEGLAVAFDPWFGLNLGPRYLLFTKGADTLVDPRLSMTFGTQDIDYSVAGSFVMFLLARHGTEVFLNFLLALGESRDMAVIREAFRAAYGVELDDEADLFIVGAQCTDQSVGPTLYDCMSPEISWGSEGLSFEGVMDCASEGVVGGHGLNNPWPTVRSVTFEVPSAGSYLLRVGAESDVGVQVGPCTSCPWESRDTLVYAPNAKARSLMLEAGVYFMRIQAWSTETPKYSVQLSPEVPGEPSP